MNKHIEFWQQRDFGVLLGEPFYFFKQEFKPFMSMLIKYAGPFLAVSMIGLSVMVFDVYDDMLDGSPNFGWYMFLFIAFLVLGYLAVFLLSISYVSLYVKAGKGNFTQADVLAVASRKIFPSIILALIITVMVIIGFILFYIPGIYLAVATSFVYIALIHEDLGIGEAISRSFQIVKEKWWKVFGLIFIFGLAVGVASYIFFIPTYLLALFMLGSDSVESYHVFLILLTAVLYFVYYLITGGLSQILIAFIYFSIRQEREGGKLHEKIQQINSEDPLKTPPTVEEKEIKEPPENTITERKEENETDTDEKSEDYNRFANPNTRNRFADPDDAGESDKPKY